MAKPTARVLVLLEVLQGGGTHRVRDLAARLGVDERTVRRYVQHLLELDVPIEAVRGRYGGYRLAPGFRLPPLMLTDEEAVATVLGLPVLRRSGLGGNEATRSAEAKVRRVLPSPLAARVVALQESLQLSSDQRPTANADTATLLLLAQAARDRCLVAFAYRSATGRDSARVLAPYGIVGHGGRWLVAGLDHDSRELRTFRVDRMVLPRRLEKTFAEPEGFDALEHVVAGIATAARRHTAVVRAQTSVGQARARLPATLAVVSEDPEGGDGWARIEIRAHDLGWVPALLARLDCPFVVEEPAELALAVAALGRRLMAAAELTRTD